VDTATGVLPLEQRSRKPLAWAAAALAAMAIGGALVALYTVMANRVSSTNQHVAALQTSIDRGSGAGIKALRTRIKTLETQTAAQQATLSSVSNDLAGAKKQLGLYKTCIPEIMTQINSLDGTIYVNGGGTYDVYPMPTEQVSSFCEPILNGASNHQ